MTYFAFVHEISIHTSKMETKSYSRLRILEIFREKMSEIVGKTASRYNLYLLQPQTKTF